MKEIKRDYVRLIALCLVALVAGFMVLLLVEILMDFELSRLISSIIILLVVAPVAFLIFPRVLGFPSGRTSTCTFLVNTGLYLPAGSLNPASSEELFYRGMMMILLLQFTNSLWNSTLIQVVLFGLMHVKDFGFGELDVFLAS